MDNYEDFGSLACNFDEERSYNEERMKELEYLKIQLRTCCIKLGGKNGNFDDAAMQRCFYLMRRVLEIPPDEQKYCDPFVIYIRQLFTVVRNLITEYTKFNGKFPYCYELNKLLVAYVELECLVYCKSSFEIYEQDDVEDITVSILRYMLHDETGKGVDDHVINNNDMDILRWLYASRKVSLEVRHSCPLIENISRKLANQLEQVQLLGTNALENDEIDISLLDTPGSSRISNFFKKCQDMTEYNLYYFDGDDEAEAEELQPIYQQELDEHSESEIAVLDLTSDLPITLAQIYSDVERLRNSGSFRSCRKKVVNHQHCDPIEILDDEIDVDADDDDVICFGQIAYRNNKQSRGLTSKSPRIYANGRASRKAASSRLHRKKVINRRHSIAARVINDRNDKDDDDVICFGQIENTNDKDSRGLTSKSRRIDANGRPLRKAASFRPHRKKVGNRRHSIAVRVIDDGNDKDGDDDDVICFGQIDNTNDKDSRGLSSKSRRIDANGRPLRKAASFRPHRKKVVNRRHSIAVRVIDDGNDKDDDDDVICFGQIDNTNDKDSRGLTSKSPRIGVNGGPSRKAASWQSHRKKVVNRRHSIAVHVIDDENDGDGDDDDVICFGQIENTNDKDSRGLTSKSPGIDANCRPLRKAACSLSPRKKVVNRRHSSAVSVIDDGNDEDGDDDDVICFGQIANINDEDSRGLISKCAQIVANGRPLRKAACSLSHRKKVVNRRHSSAVSVIDDGNDEGGDDDDVICFGQIANTNEKNSRDAGVVQRPRKKRICRTSPKKTVNNVTRIRYRRRLACRITRPGHIHKQTKISILSHKMQRAALATTRPISIIQIDDDNDDVINIVD